MTTADAAIEEEEEEEEEEVKGERFKRYALSASIQPNLVGVEILSATFREVCILYHVADVKFFSSRDEGKRRNDD